MFEKRTKENPQLYHWNPLLLWRVLRLSRKYRESVEKFYKGAETIGDRGSLNLRDFFLHNTNNSDVKKFITTLTEEPVISTNIRKWFSSNVSQLRANRSSKGSVAQRPTNQRILSQYALPEMGDSETDFCFGRLSPFERNLNQKHYKRFLQDFGCITLFPIPPEAGQPFPPFFNCIWMLRPLFIASVYGANWIAIVKKLQESSGINLHHQQFIVNFSIPSNEIARALRESAPDTSVLEQFISGRQVFNLGRNFNWDDTLENKIAAYEMSKQKTMTRADIGRVFYPDHNEEWRRQWVASACRTVGRLISGLEDLTKVHE